MTMKRLLENFKRFLEEAPAECKLPRGANRGDVAEGIVAAAIVAKLSKRIDGEIGDVTPEDVVEYVSKITSPKATITSRVLDLRGRVEDTVSFSIAMPAKSFAALVDPNLVHCFMGEYGGAAKYVNNPSMQRFALRLATNGMSNDIRVSAQGTDDQKGTKVDIQINVDGRRLQNSISLKVKGGDQFAQTVGPGFDKQEGFFGPLGIDVSNVKGEYEALVSQIPKGKPYASREEIDKLGILDTARQATKLVYDEAFRVLESYLQEDKMEAAFVTKLADFIKRGATLDDSDFVELVKISPNSFKRARFGKKFYRQIQDANLYPIIKYGAKGNPSIEIRYRDGSGKDTLLVRFRAKLERASGTTAKYGKRYGVLMRNYLESGDALYELAGI